MKKHFKFVQPLLSCLHPGLLVNYSEEAARLDAANRRP